MQDLQLTTTYNSKVSKQMKGLILFLAGILVGAFLCYGYMWYQVFEKLDRVWTCQVFTGKLSIEEEQKCK